NHARPLLDRFPPARAAHSAAARLPPRRLPAMLRRRSAGWGPPLPRRRPVGEQHSLERRRLTAVAPAKAAPLPSSRTRRSPLVENYLLALGHAVATSVA